MEYNYPSIIERIINQAQDKLNDWEIGFMSSVYQQTFPLTEKQKAIILKINRKYIVNRRT